MIKLKNIDKKYWIILIVFLLLICFFITFHYIKVIKPKKDRSELYNELFKDCYSLQLYNDLLQYCYSYDYYNDDLYNKVDSLSKKISLLLIVKEKIDIKYPINDISILKLDDVIEELIGYELYNTEYSLKHSKYETNTDKYISILDKICYYGIFFKKEMGLKLDFEISKEQENAFEEYRGYINKEVSKHYKKTHQMLEE